MNDDRSDVPPGLVGWSRGDRVVDLRHRLQSGNPLVLPGAPNAIMARLVEQAGFGACYLSGAGVANSQFGLPDVGLVGLDEMASELARVADAVQIPIVADADDGYGGPLGVMRTVRRFEAAGASAIQLEDQVAPKRCGHFARKRVVATEAMVAKLKAAVRARTADTVIIARTDAIAVEGFERAIHRGATYLEAGADALFVEAPESLDQLRAIGRAFRGVPLVANVVEGGRTPEHSAAELAELGFQVILYANTAMRVALHAARAALSHLARTGDTAALREQMLSWDDRQRLVNTDRTGALEDRLSAGQLSDTQERTTGSSRSGHS